MAFYIRYYDDETLLQKAEEIIPYLQGINKLSPAELDIIAKRITKLRSGTNRIYLDTAKKRYLLAIGTTQTSIEAFQKNAKPAARPGGAAIANPSPEPKEEVAVPASPTQKDNTAEWGYYNLYFTLMKNEQPQSFLFKAKMRNATLDSAYQQMANYLKEKHGDLCLIPEFSEEVIWSEPIK